MEVDVLTSSAPYMTLNTTLSVPSAFMVVDPSTKILRTPSGTVLLSSTVPVHENRHGNRISNMANMVLFDMPG